MPMKIAKATFATLTIIFLVAPLIAILPLAFTSSVILTYPIPSWSLATPLTSVLSSELCWTPSR